MLILTYNINILQEFCIVFDSSVVMMVVFGKRTLCSVHLIFASRLKARLQKFVLILLSDQFGEPGICLSLI